MYSLKKLVRRYWLAFYWLIFACFTSVAAQYPGLVLHPETVPYPWPGVIFTWGLLAVFTAVLYGILRPATFRRSWARIGYALLFATALLVLTVFTFGTDMPGFVYVPMYFSFLTFVGLVAYALFMASAWAWERYRNAP